MATLSGKTLFITGASRGIGLAIALRAARDGANVAIAAKSSVPNPKLPGTIQTAAQAVNDGGGRGLALKCDIREEDDVHAAVAATVEAFGGIGCRRGRRGGDRQAAPVVRASRRRVGVLPV